MACATPIGPTGVISIPLSDRTAAWDGELVDTAIVLSPGADDLVELRGIEINRGWRVRGRSTERRLACGERIMNHACHFDRIAMTSDMHIERRRTRAQQMIVHGSYFKATFD